MTEQDVHNTLHSFDVIKQFQTSGHRLRDSPLKISLTKTRTLSKMSILTSLSFSITHIQLTEFG